MPQWYLTLKDVAETISFLLVPVLVVLAWRGLRQVKLAAEQVKIAAQQVNIAQKALRIDCERQVRSRALDMCENFAEIISVHANPLSKALNEGNYTAIKGAKVTIEGNYATVTGDLERMMTEARKDNCKVLNALNKFEAFAMNFTAGIADEEVAFPSTGRTYCKFLEQFIPVLVALNGQQKLYHNTLALWSAWKKRIEQEDLDATARRAKSELEKIQVPKFKVLGRDE